MATMIAGSFLATKSASAQAYSSDVTNLQVVIPELRSIKVNSLQKDVVLTFATADDFKNGVSSKQTKHLEVTSTGKFQVKVAASSNLRNALNEINVNTISLTPELNSGVDPNTNNTYNLVNLKVNAPQVLISSNLGTVQSFFDVSYKASGGVEYIDKAKGTYQTVVTYELTDL